MPGTKLDTWVENTVRGLARHSTRRSFLASLGTLMIASFAFPLLPVARPAHAAGKGGGQKPKGPQWQDKDDTRCDYWRYCSLDGYPCTCCGGTITQCPPGTQLSTTAWVASCRNPRDGKMYLFAYRDCCGKNICNRCPCLNTQGGEQPFYRIQRNNDLVWCFGAGQETTYHCTITPIVSQV